MLQLHGQQVTSVYRLFWRNGMCGCICQWPGLTLAIVIACGTSVAVRGQEGGQMPPMAAGQYAAPMQAQQGLDSLTFDDIRARLDQQQQQISILQDQLRSVQQAPQIIPAADSPQQSEAAVKQVEDAKKAAEGYRIGSDLSIKANFKDGLFLWLETPNKDFTMHLGAWMQWDNVWWNQSPALRAAPGSRPGNAQGVATGVALGGIGELEDGEYFRRIRPFAEGTFWETGEYRLIPALENNQFSTSGLDEFWVGANSHPRDRDSPRRARQRPDGP